MNRTRNTIVATLMAGSALLAVAACSNGDGKDSAPAATASPASNAPDNPAAPQASAAGDSEQAPSDGKGVGQLTGNSGITGKVHSVTRRDGMVLVKFEVTNRSSENYLAVDWRDGTEVYTLAGSSIVDRAHKKRYMALIDTNNRCLCSEHVGSIDKGQTRQFYAQFEAPSNDVKQVDLALGTLSVVTVPLQEG
ncbi:hypothetical protein [Streptomyces sp. NPDC048638]|uniref:hypothetical protein n=1 Tax=Streptomyces sp. NPDC048638 TaxID=3365580 RepID=UPI00371D7840